MLNFDQETGWTRAAETVQGGRRWSLARTRAPIAKRNETMAVTALDSNSALIVIDLQKGITTRPIAGVADVVGNAARLAQAFRAKGLPVVLVHVIGMAPGRTEQPRPNIQLDSDFAEFDPALNRQESDIVVAKRTWGAFTGTELEQILRSRGVTEVVLCGIATSAGVESTARHAHELGFNVALVTDAMTDMSEEAHRRSTELIFPRLGETATTDELLALLDKHGA
jgi:nicotinamidase-related amidase